MKGVNFGVEIYGGEVLPMGPPTAGQRYEGCAVKYGVGGIGSDAATVMFHGALTWLTCTGVHTTRTFTAPTESNAPVVQVATEVALT